MEKQNIFHWVLPKNRIDVGGPHETLKNQEHFQTYEKFFEHMGKG